MQRRHFLGGAVAVCTVVAGCAEGDDTGATTDVDSGDPSPTVDGTDVDSAFDIEGELRASEKFEAVTLSARANEDNTLTVRAVLRYTGEGAVVVSGLLFNYYDSSGGDLISSNSSLESERTVESDATVDIELATDDLGKVDATAVASFEAIVNSRPV